VADVVAALRLRLLMVDHLILATLDPQTPVLTTLISFRTERLSQHPGTAGRITSLMMLLERTPRLRMLTMISACLTFRMIMDMITGLPRLPHLTSLQLPRMLISAPRLLASVDEILDACPRVRVLHLGMALDPRVLDLARKKQVIVRF
jgi:hypothetical protein